MLDQVVQANNAQMADTAFVKELKAWIRFNGADGVRTGDGLYSVSSGSPSIPTWIGDLGFGLFSTPKSENERYARQIRSAAGIEVGAIRPQFARWLGIGLNERPDLVVRFGRGPAMPPSMRRPVQAVLA